MSQTLRTLVIIFTFAALGACGRDSSYKEASELERQGMFLRAAQAYKLFAETYPQDKRAPDALFRAAGIYSRKLDMCSSSAPVLERLLKNYQDYPARKEALKNLFICPDYFPVAAAARLTYGDSQTGGKNARQVVNIAGIINDKAKAAVQLYAGRQLVAKQKKIYSFKEFDFRESYAGFDTIIIKYPPVKDTLWTSASAAGKELFSVAAVGIKVKTRAGEFQRCLKIKRQQPGQSSWIYEYYAPWTGKILTSVAGKGFENNVTELLTYEKTQ